MREFEAEAESEGSAFEKEEKCILSSGILEPLSSGNNHLITGIDWNKLGGDCRSVISFVDMGDVLQDATGIAANSLDESG